MFKMNEQIDFYRHKLEYETDSYDLHEALNSDKPPVVVDARSVNAFNTERIPGALSLPHRTMNEESTASLDRDKVYVVYCDGIGCNASTKGALNLSRLGFRVRELMGGLDWWKRDGYQTEGSMAGEGKEVACNC